MKKYKNKYRIPSTRLRTWDYGWNALYFITICTKNREHFFGDVVNGKMILSKIGEMANKYWHEIPEHFPFVKLHEFVVMPNHVHGIIEIAKMDDGQVQTQNFAPLPSPVQTQNFASVPSPPSKNKFAPQSKNLASIIRGYKIGVTKNAKKINQNWGWLPRYHDHIIRDKKAYLNISNYIINNPQKWQVDKFHSDN